MVWCQVESKKVRKSLILKDNGNLIIHIWTLKAQIFKIREPFSQYFECTVVVAFVVGCLKSQRKSSCIQSLLLISKTLKEAGFSLFINLMKSSRMIFVRLISKTSRLFLQFYEDFPQIIVMSPSTASASTNRVSEIFSCFRLLKLMLERDWYPLALIKHLSALRITYISLALKYW